MARVKIDFGIDLGTTNSAIAVMNNGKSKIFKNDVNGETMPSSVTVTKKGYLVGAKSFAQLPVDKRRAYNNPNFKTNIFIEFKRTIGNSIKHSTAQGELSSEDLSAEILKTLKSYVDEENIKSAIITIPAAFEMNQINATKKAAELAGIEYVELVQEPYAAAIAYGVQSSNKNGFWLVFDFGGGTFDSALVKVSDGIIKVLDTEGDNFLGGKNLDEAIVDEIFIPYLKDNFKIESITSNPEKFNAFKEMWKPLAEDAKNQLSYKEEYPILTQLYDEYGEDDEGEEFEIELTVTREQLKKVITPFIQKAIDYSNTLLNRNNLKGQTLDELILVGGPTLSPVVREMLQSQIKKPNTSIDPMTVVAEGAAIYASSINNPVEEDNVDTSKIQLHIDYEAMVVGESTFITIKTKDADKIVFAEIAREDDAFKSEKVGLNNIGEVIELNLKSEEMNVFSVLLYDEKGNKLDCEPNNFSIKEGAALGGATLTHTICIEVIDKQTGNKILKPLIGLEKDKSLPANGVFNGLTTRKQIRPGMDDFIDIPIYQGTPFTRAILNNYVTTIKITGNDLPALLPEGSSADLKLDFDRSSNFKGKINFIDIDFEMPLKITTELSKITEEWLLLQINDTKASIDKLDSVEKDELKEKLSKVKNIFENKKTESGRLEARSELQKLAKSVDEIENQNEWPKLEEKLKDAFHNLEDVNQEKGNEQTNHIIDKTRRDVEQAIKEKDKKNTPQLIETINSLSFELERLEHLMGFILSVDRDFDTINWRDRNAARVIIESGKSIIYTTPSLERLQPIVNNLFENGDFGSGNNPEEPKLPGGLLRG